MDILMLEMKKKQKYNKGFNRNKYRAKLKRYRN